jgi:U2-associated protein SR140
MDRKVFEHLERLPAKLGMGRMTERGYRDEVNTILKVWEDEHLFDDTTLKHLSEAFNAREKQKEEEEQARRLAEKRKRKGNAVRKVPTSDATEEDEQTMDVDETAGDATVEPEQTFATATPEAPVAEVVVPADPPKDVEIPGETAVARARRLRPKAEDMFALDEED